VSAVGLEEMVLAYMRDASRAGGCPAQQSQPEAQR
jgi:hypothetical protein